MEEKQTGEEEKKNDGEIINVYNNSCRAPINIKYKLSEDRLRERK